MVNFKPLLESGQFSDLTISPVFTMMCTGPFKEASSCVIDLSDHDIETLDLLLEYLYTGDYNECKPVNSAARVDDQCINEAEIDTTPNDAMVVEQNTDDPTISGTAEHTERIPVPLQATNVIMYALGERYDISALKDLAEQKLATHEFTEWSDQLREVIELIYTTTPESDRRLRDTIRDNCGQHTSSLIQNQDIIDAMLKVPSFGVDLCKGSLIHSDHRWKKEHAKVLEAQEETRKAKNEARRQAAMTDIAQAEKDDMERKFFDLKALINSIGNCRNCHKEFTPWKVYPLGNFAKSPVVVRCSKCRAKHKR
ncbi:hypothetical protein MMC17_002376 [Xylographa soralifera]|nr:hypothetical protein [Xylographa soralifera]